MSIVLGMGHKVEHFQRSLKYGAILGGSEEIMADLGIYICIRIVICVSQNQNDVCSEFVAGIKQAMKYFPKSSKL